MMGARDVVEIVDGLEAAGVPVWLDGGWGVDALIGRATRAHDDLDLVLALDRADAARRALVGLGFAVIEDAATACFVARDPRDRRVDVHTVVFDAEGGGLQRLEDGGLWRSPPEGFSGRGRVGGREVACLSAAVQVLCHSGYEPDEMDRRDLRLLAESRDLTLPAPYTGREAGSFRVPGGSGAWVWTWTPAAVTSVRLPVPNRNGQGDRGGRAGGA